MGVESSIFIGYGFRIPESYYKNLLRKDPEDDNYYIGDNNYTHELFDENETFIYGKILDTNPNHSGFYNIQNDIFNARLKYNNFIDAEAKLNNTHASFLFFMNDKE